MIGIMTVVKTKQIEKINCENQLNYIFKRRKKSVSLFRYKSLVGKNYLNYYIYFFISIKRHFSLYYSERSILRGLMPYYITNKHF